MKENEELKEAGKKLKGLSEEERLERIAELREKAILDEKSAYGTGLEEGERKEKLQIAKRLLEKNMPIKEIMEITNLSEEEILKIKK